MKIDFGAALAIAILAGLPAASLAQPQQHPQAAHSAAPRPAAHAPAMRAPAMRAPAAHFHAAPAAHRSTVHRAVTHRTVHRTVRRSTAARTHVVRHAVHRSGHVARAARHSPRVAALRKNVFARHRFHAGAYRAPQGYRYRRWRYGQFMPAVYWGRNYWLSDFLAFGLFAPPSGYVWVRYGPDAVLIDEYTGEIIRVDYGVFF